MSGAAPAASSTARRVTSRALRDREEFPVTRFLVGAVGAVGATSASGCHASLFLPPHLRTHCPHTRRMWGQLDTPRFADVRAFVRHWRRRTVAADPPREFVTATRADPPPRLALARHPAGAQSSPSKIELRMRYTRTLPSPGRRSRRARWRPSDTRCPRSRNSRNTAPASKPSHASRSKTSGKQ